MLLLRSIFSVPIPVQLEAEEAAKLLRRRSVCKRPVMGGLSRLRDLRRKSPREAWSRPMDDSKTPTFWSELINCPTHLVTQRQQPLGFHTGQLAYPWYRMFCLSEGGLMTLYNNTTQPPITLPHMATLLSCVLVAPGSDYGPENKQRNETKSVTRAPPIPSTSYPISHWSSSTALSHHNSTHSDRNTRNI